MEEGDEARVVDVQVGSEVLGSSLPECLIYFWFFHSSGNPNVIWNIL